MNRVLPIGRDVWHLLLRKYLSKLDREMLQHAMGMGGPLKLRSTRKAAEQGYLEVLQWLKLHDCAWSDWCCTMAAVGGHVDVLKWLVREGCPWDMQMTCERAAFFGQLEALKWLIEIVLPTDSMRKQVCIAAATGGQLEVLEWLKTFEWYCDDHTWVYAAANGHLHVLQWAKKGRGCGCEINIDACCEVAMKGGHHDVVSWLRKTE